MGRKRPEYPTLFAKFAGSLVGARDDIVLPAAAERVDWEAELAFVIGRRARHVRGREAEAAIAGFTVFNDVSARDWQSRTTQYLQGKTFEHTTPVGPALVTSDELDGALGLRITCEVDGRLMQDATTAELIFAPAEIVSYVSQVITLEPGDLIATGTPAGVGDGRDPKVYLQPGQVVRTAIEGVGELINRCVMEPPPGV
jgi:acylpyruvate hydrolase